jgi:hypothetical protein
LTWSLCTGSVSVYKIIKPKKERRRGEKENIEKKIKEMIWKQTSES